MLSTLHISVSLLAGLIFITNAFRTGQNVETVASTPVMFPLTEPEHERYIFVDTENNNVHLTMPIVGGDEFGVDNTCKTAIELQHFIRGGNSYKEEERHITSVLDRLEKYRDALDFDIWLLEKLVAERKDDARLSNLTVAKVRRFKQVNAYIEAVTPTLGSWDDYSMSGPFPVFPDSIHEAIESSKNIFTMLLTPRRIDSYLRLRAPSFGAASHQDRRNSLLHNGFARQLIEFLGSKKASLGAGIPTAAKDLEDYVFKGTFQRNTNATQKLYEEMQRRIVDYFQSRGKVKSPFTYPALQGLVDEIIYEWPNMDGAYYNTKMLEFGQGIEKDFPRNASFLALELVNFFPPETRGDPDMASVMIQAFLGLVNLHYKAYLCNEHNPDACGNLWDFLEGAPKVPINGTLWLEGIGQIYAALKDPDPEEALIQWAGEKYFRAALGDGLKRRLKKRFETFWTTVWKGPSPAPHFDEWLFLFKDLKGLGFTHQGTISIDFADFFARCGYPCWQDQKPTRGTMKTLEDLAQSFKSRTSGDSGLPYKNSGILQSVSVDEDWLERRMAEWDMVAKPWVKMQHGVRLKSLARRTCSYLLYALSLMWLLVS